ncbi:MAG: lysophospholipase L1-like esterase [Rhodothermales bacterium]|jgi:lysophospholipase L1-like esterase
MNRLLTRAAIAVLTCITASHADSATSPRVKSGDKICFIGDSITAMGTRNPYGYVQMAVAGLNANGIDVEWKSNCGGGQTSQGVLERFMPATLAYKPNFVSIVIGTNDVGHQKVAKSGTVSEGTNGVFLPRHKANYRAFTDKFTDAGISVLILTPPPHGEPRTSERDLRLLPYVAFLKEFAKEKGYPLVDLHGMMRTEINQRATATGETPKYIVTCDGCHMNPIGDMIMAKAILQGYGLTEAQIQKAESHWLNERNPPVKIDSQHLPVSVAKKFESLSSEQQAAVKLAFAKVMESEIAKASTQTEAVTK